MAPNWLKELDDVLRGRKADPLLLATWTSHIQIQPLVIVSVISNALRLRRVRL